MGLLLASGREDSRCRSQRPAEVPGEMGLVVEARLGGRLRGGVAGQEQPAGAVHATADDVLVRGDPVGLGEYPDEVTAVGAQVSGRLGDGEGLFQAIIEQVTQSAGQGLVSSSVDR